MMTKRNAVTGVRQRAFTLTELLVVVAIMAVLLGLTLTPFQSILSGSGVDGAERMLTSQLRMARQYAISKRKEVAVLMPGSGASVPDQLKYIAFRSYNVDDGEWIENTEWNFIPTGAIISKVEDGDLVDDVDMAAAAGQTSPFLVGSVRAVVFSPTGGLSHGSATITVKEGVVTDGTTTVRNDDNYKEININQFTGRIEVLSPGDS